MPRHKVQDCTEVPILCPNSKTLYLSILRMLLSLMFFPFVPTGYKYYLYSITKPVFYNPV